MTLALRTADLFADAALGGAAVDFVVELADAFFILPLHALRGGSAVAIVRTFFVTSSESADERIRAVGVDTAPLT